MGRKKQSPTAGKRVIVTAAILENFYNVSVFTIQRCITQLAKLSFNHSIGRTHSRLLSLKKKKIQRRQPYGDDDDSRASNSVAGPCSFLHLLYLPQQSPQQYHGHTPNPQIWRAQRPGCQEENAVYPPNADVLKSGQFPLGQRERRSSRHVCRRR